MRLLLIGGGGREHALAWKLTREEPDLELIAAPGNPGIGELGECVPLNVLDLDGLEGIARERRVDLTVVGPEAPLEAGIVDRFRAAGLPIFGPTRAAARIETSKAFAKQLLLDEGIPTARAEIHNRVASAKAAARRFGAPVVVKASGLAAGKGVIVCKTVGDADTAIDEILEGNRFGPAGAEVLIEEFMMGEEVSLFAITDGRHFVVLPGLQDHKRLLANDLGPNTGGMGAYLPVQLGYDADRTLRFDPDSADRLALQAAREIFAPTLRALAARGCNFTGLLYAGLMLTRDGPKVVEFNCRFGDPETQALMPVLDVAPRLLDLLLAVGRGEPLPGFPVPDAEGAIRQHGSSRISTAEAEAACVTTVLAAANYPETPRTGDVISLPPTEDGVYVFHAGTARDAEGRLVTAGGRVLAVSAVAPSVELAQSRSLEFAERVRFDGKQYRSDIGWREIARQTGRSGAGASRD
ncbi:MAG TPA: phosphoribosylamine--glycine ligase [Gemmatimonadaceae bacterium]|nr:phosphoribosylamine--glycine ligase [Gemmatimonadaceae bacterium]